MSAVQDVLCLVTACAFLCTLSLAATHQRLKRQMIFPDQPPRARNYCVTPDRRDGQCIVVTGCPGLTRGNNAGRLRRFYCGFEGNVGKVCCPEGSESERFRNPTPPAPRPAPAPIAPQPPRPNPPVVSRSSKPDFLPVECGRSSTTKTKVVGGREAEKGSWPWMAILYVRTRGGERSPDCGGALVTRSHVVTAAHCVMGRRSQPLSPSSLSVRLGEHDLYRDDDGMNPVDVNVRDVRVHEQFSGITFRNDIAVLLLERPVEFNTHIQPICLPYDSLRDEDLSRRSGFVSGWGRTSFRGAASDVLREVSLPIVDNESCRNAYAQLLPVTDTNVCAGTDDGSKDSCQGDSGGPLMMPGKERRYYLMGVVSVGNRCAEPGYPGIYTRVTSYLDWLTQNLSS